MSEPTDILGKLGQKVGQTIKAHTGKQNNPHSVNKTQVGLGNVENTKLSTWTGSSSIAKVGTLTDGTIPWGLISGGPDLASSTGVDGDFTVAGKLTVNGGTTTLNTQTVVVEDNIIEVNLKADGGESAQTGGIQVNRGATSATSAVGTLKVNVGSDGELDFQQIGETVNGQPAYQNLVSGSISAGTYQIKFEESLDTPSDGVYGGIQPSAFVVEKLNGSVYEAYNTAEVGGGNEEPVTVAYNTDIAQVDDDDGGGSNASTSSIANGYWFFSPEDPLDTGTNQGGTSGNPNWTTQLNQGDSVHFGNSTGQTFYIYRQPPGNYGAMNSTFSSVGASSSRTITFDLEGTYYYSKVSDGISDNLGGSWTVGPTVYQTVTETVDEPAILYYTDEVTVDLPQKLEDWHNAARLGTGIDDELLESGAQPEDGNVYGIVSSDAFLTPSTEATDLVTQATPFVSASVEDKAKVIWDDTTAKFALKLGDSSASLVADKLYYKNKFDGLGDLPNAVQYHGMVAHVHATGQLYYAHGEVWNELISVNGGQTIDGNISATVFKAPDGAGITINDIALGNYSSFESAFNAAIA